MKKHGEYKVPGGKLVVVDFSVEAEQFSHVCITGDFFVFPEDALAAVAQSIEGQPISASAVDLQLCMSQAMPADAELLGFSLVDVLAAIRRALA